MSQFPTTIAAVLPVLAFLASSAGAGLLASWLFDRLRSRFPLPAQPPVEYWARLLYTWLYAPRFARVFTLLLPQLIVIVASLVTAALTGTPIVKTLDLASAAAIAAIIAQLRHGVTLSSQLPVRDAGPLARPLSARALRLRQMRQDLHDSMRDD